MIADVVFAVAVITVALGAVTELQLRIGNIGSATDCTAMVVFGLLPGLPEGDRTAARCGILLLFLVFHPPGSGHQIQNITSGEQQVVAQCDQREEIVREEHGWIA